MKKITSRTNEEIKSLLNLAKEKGAYFLLEGEHLIMMALASKKVVTLYGLVPYRDYETTLITPEIAKKLSKKKSPPAFFAKVKKPCLALDTTKSLLYLDNVQDPANVGALMRSALAFNFGGIIISENSAHFYHEKTLSAAQGAHFLLPHIYGNKNTLLKLEAAGYTLLGTTLGHKAITVSTLPKNTKYVVVLGSEGQGISQEISEIIQRNTLIPITNIDSLNVAIAGAIIMYELGK